MAGSKKSKTVGRKENPFTNKVCRGDNLEQYYFQKPAWNFSSIDKDFWSFNRENVGDYFWTDILPRLQAFETQTWNEILVTNKKSNHSIDAHALNKSARDRLDSLFIEMNSIISLRLNSTCRLYGYMTENVFNLLWYDDNHGDNPNCVCRSYKKHT